MKLLSSSTTKPYIATIFHGHITDTLYGHICAATDAAATDAVATSVQQQMLWPHSCSNRCRSHIRAATDATMPDLKMSSFSETCLELPDL